MPATAISTLTGQTVNISEGRISISGDFGSRSISLPANGNFP